MTQKPQCRSTHILLTIMLLLFGQAFAQNPITSYQVNTEQKIGEGQGGFSPLLTNVDRFGAAARGIGDVNGDGIEDIAIGANGDDDGGTDKGAVYILFMNANGTVASHQKISDTQGGLVGSIDDNFGVDIESIGDFNNDGIPDIAVGEARGNDGGTRRGHVWILLLNANGTVQNEYKISDTQGNFTGILSNNDRFGQNIANLGDLDGNGTIDLAVGSVFDDDGGIDQGAVWILFMNSNGTVSSHQKISETAGNLTSPLASLDNFGVCVEAIGDLDGDGVTDLAVGSRGDDDGATNAGACYILFLNANGTVKDEQKISNLEGGLGTVLATGDRFGGNFGFLGDHTGDGFQELAVGSYLDDEGGTDRGAVYVLSLASDGTVQCQIKISDTKGGFTQTLGNDDRLGRGLGVMNDIDGDGKLELLLGAVLHDGGGTDKGSAWLVTLKDTITACYSPSGSAFHRLSGGTSDDRLTSIIERSDGGFVMVGYTSSFGAGGNDVYVAKLNSCLIPVWEKTYGSSASEQAYSVVQTFDGGYMVGGRTSGFGSQGDDMLLLKLDEQGLIEWSRMIGANGGDICRIIRQTADSGYVATGYTALGAGANDVLLVRVDASGQTVWSKSYGESANDFPHHLEIAPNGDIIVAGYRRDYTPSTDYQGLLMRTDDAGNLSWYKSYSGTGRENWNSFVIENNGDLVITGTTNTVGAGDLDHLLMRTDTAGNFQWAQVTGGALFENAFGLVKTTDGGYLSRGVTTSFGGGGNDLFLIKQDSGGTVQWTQAIGSTGDDSKFAGALESGIIQTADNGFLLAAASSSFGNSHQNYLVKTNAQGQTNCFSTATTATTVSFTPTVTSLTPSVQNQTPTNNSITPTVNVICTVDSVSCTETTIEAEFDANQDSICFGDTVHFTNQTSPINNSYWWMLNDSVFSTATDTSLLFDSVGTYTVSLAVLDSMGNTDTNSRVITVHPNPIVAFSFLEQCLGSGTQFSDSSTISSGSITGWGWNFGDSSNLDTAQHPVHTFGDTGTYFVSLTATSNFGCSSQLDSVPVVIHSKPVAGFEAPLVCFGDTTFFTDTSSTVSGTITSWIWDFGTGDSALVQNPSYIYTQSGSLQTILVVTTDLGCTDTVVQSISVQPLPVLNPIISNGCQGSPIAFSDASSGGSSGGGGGGPGGGGPGGGGPGGGSSLVAWEWDFLHNDTINDTMPSGTFVFSDWGTTPIHFTVIDSFGCQDTMLFNIEVHPKPQAGFTDASGCYLDSTLVVDTSSIAQGSIVSWNYDWIYGVNSISSAQNPIIPHITSGVVDTLTQIVQSDSGCLDTAVAPFNAYELADTQISGNFYSCFGAPMFLKDSAESINGSPFVSRSWDFDSDQVIDTTVIGDGSYSIQHTYPDTGTFPVSYKLIDSLGCERFVTFSATVHPLPVAGFDFQNTCLGDSVAFSDTSTVLNGTINGWYWGFGAGQGFTSGSPNIKHLFPDTGTYYVSLQVTYNPIGSTCSGRIDSIPVEIKSLPVAHFDAPPVCLNESTVFTDSSSTLSGTITSWNWQFGDGQSSTATNPVHVYTNDSIYTVSLRVETNVGCVDSVQQQVQAYSLPEVQISLQNDCQFQSVPFTDASQTPNGFPLVSWAWDVLNDGAVEYTTANANHNFSNYGTFDVELLVTDSFGCSDSVVSPILIHPKPVANYVSGNNCLGSPTFFFDTSTVALGSLVSWDWGFGDGNSSTVQHPQNNYQNPGTYNIDLTVESDSGCRDTISGVLAITVFPLPVSNFSFSKTCYPDSTYFIDSTSIQNGNISSWLWSFNNGSVLSNDQNPTFQFAGPGQYEVTLLAISNEGCSEAKIDTVDVFALPQVSFTTDPVCAFQQMPITNASTILTGSIGTWEWNFGDGTTSNLQTPNKTFTSGGVFDIKLVATADSTGCVDSITIPEMVYSLPQVDFQRHNACEDSLIQFTNNSITTNGSPLTSWQWDIDLDGTTDYLSEQITHTYANPGIYNIQLLVHDSLGCADSLSQAVVVHPRPDADFSFQTVCFLDSTMLVDQSTIAAGNITEWSWDFADGNSSTLQSPKHVYNTIDTFEVTLSVVSDSGCRSAQVQKPVAVFAQPSSQFSASNVCVYDDMVFTEASTISEGSISQWDWRFGDGLGSAQQAPSHRYNTFGNYSIELVVTSNNGCQDSITVMQTVYARPTASFPVQVICLGDTHAFENLSSIPIGSIDAWRWDFNDGDTALRETPTHEFLQTGVYAVKLVATSNEGCQDSITRPMDVVPSPTANFTFTPDCANQPIAFQGRSLLDDGFIQIREWDFGDLNQNSGTFDPLHQYAAGGSYAVQYIVGTNRGCYDTITKTVEVFPVPTVQFAVLDTAGCAPFVAQFENQSFIDPASKLEYAWFTNDTLLFSTDENPSLVLQNQSGAVLRESIRLEVSSDRCTSSLELTDVLALYPQPKAAFTTSANPVSVYESDIQFINRSSADALFFDWDLGTDGGFSTDQNPQFLYENAGNYRVELLVENSWGCIDSTSRLLRVTPETSFYIPNAFTPDRNGLNDDFRVYGENLEPEFIFTIYNRWGEKLFQTNNPKEGWNGYQNGQLSPFGVYVYKVHFYDSENAVYRDLKGHFTLLP